jgi:ribosomal protein L35
MKTNKSFLKRIRVTKNGKLVARKPGQLHFNAKQSGSQRSQKRRTVSLHLSAKVRRRFLPGSGA